MPPVGPPPALPVRAPRADCATGGIPLMDLSSALPSAAADLVSATAAELLSCAAARHGTIGCDGSRGAADGEAAAAVGSGGGGGGGGAEEQEGARGAAELDDTLTLAYSASSDEDIGTARGRWVL